MARMITFIFTLILFSLLSLKAQQDTLTKDPRQKKAAPAAPQKGQDASKALIDTSYNPGTKKGDSLSNRKSKRPAVLKKRSKYETPGMKTRDTTYRAK